MKLIVDDIGCVRDVDTVDDLFAMEQHMRQAG